MTAIAMLPIIARPLPLHAVYDRLGAAAAEIALLAAQMADREPNRHEARDIETLAVIYAEDAQRFRQRARDLAPRNEPLIPAQAGIHPSPANSLPRVAAGEAAAAPSPPPGAAASPIDDAGQPEDAA